MADAVDSIDQDTNKAKKRLLHIEDDQDFLTYVKLILDDIAEIDQAINLKQAHDSISQNHYDLVLLDLHLPDGSGMDIVTSLHTRQPETPIVIFSVDNVTTNINHVAKVFQKGHFSERSLVNAIRVLTS